MSASFPCKGLLFDCDGVLVDSDESVISAWSRWAVRYELAPDDVIALVHGRRSADTVNLLIPEPHRDEALRLIDQYEIEDAAAVRALPGAHDLLESLPGSAWAVVTSALGPLARARIAASGLPKPPVLITADLVEQGKPAPEGYLAGSARLGIPAGVCVVFEDAPSGITAARAAGVAAVIGIGQRSAEAGVDAAVADLRGVRYTGAAVKLAVTELRH